MRIRISTLAKKHFRRHECSPSLTDNLFAAALSISLAPTHPLTLQEAHSGSVFGVIHFINKGFNEEPFGEADEFYATVFATQARNAAIYRYGVILFVLPTYFASL
jgi:hypothetical protein